MCLSMYVQYCARLAVFVSRAHSWALLCSAQLMGHLSYAGDGCSMQGGGVTGTCTRDVTWLCAMMFGCLAVASVRELLWFSMRSLRYTRQVACSHVFNCVWGGDPITIHQRGSIAWAGTRGCVSQGALTVQSHDRLNNVGVCAGI
jgi:hypothetical protein